MGVEVKLITFCVAHLSVLTYLYSVEDAGAFLLEAAGRIRYCTPKKPVCNRAYGVRES